MQRKPINYKDILSMFLSKGLLDYLILQTIQGSGLKINSLLSKN
jgi:hypothetical protein